MKRMSALIGCVLVLVLSSFAMAQQKMAERWNYVSANLQSDAGFEYFPGCSASSRRMSAAPIS